MASAARDLLVRLFGAAGVEVGGGRPWDLQVHEPAFYERVLGHGSLGFGDSYVDGWWDCDQLDELIHRVLRADLEASIRGDLRATLTALRARVIDRWVAGRRPVEVTAHYELGNDFFASMLGPTMSYSCAYWREAEDLDAAQRAKHALVERKLGVTADHRVLDLGCGWGGLARDLAARTGAAVTAVNVSAEQIAWARTAPPPARGAVEWVHADFWSPALARLGRFDRIASVGMLEHIGRRNYRRYVERVRDRLRDDGLFLLHTIGTSVSTDVTDAWIERRIFPGSVLASIADIARAVEGLFVVEDWHNFAADYDRTLLAWCANLERGAAGRDPRLHRTFRYYLRAFAGCFRARRTIQLWQVVLSPRGVPGGYRSPR